MDSSLVVGPPTVGRPLRLRPFKAWRLAPARVGDPATARLFARPYRDVAERLARWRADKQLLDDGAPALYLHEYTAGGLVVRGFVGALDLSHRAAGNDDRAVVPHEGVHAHQVSDLAERMGTWELNAAPILLAYRGPAVLRDLIHRTLATAPRHEYVDRAEQRHRVWALSGPALLEEVNEALAGSRALIADGHHRYAAHLSLQGQRPGGGSDCALVTLVDQGDTPLHVGAIHRVLSGVSLEDVRRACPPSASYAPVPASRALAALAPDRLVATDGADWCSIHLDLSPDRAAVEVLHHDVLTSLALGQRRVTFHHSADAAMDNVRATRGVAVLMPAPEFDTVVAVAEAGRLLPKKATSFQPKPSIGVLIRSLHDG
jgi:uncharacterized protein (DUF1015 family)